MRRSQKSTRRTSPIEETHDELIWGVDETNSMATRRIGAIHADTIGKVDATNSEDDETTRNNGSTSRKTNLVSDLTSYKTSVNSKRLRVQKDSLCYKKQCFSVVSATQNCKHKIAGWLSAHLHILL